MFRRITRYDDKIARSGIASRADKDKKVLGLCASLKMFHIEAFLSLPKNEFLLKFLRNVEILGGFNASIGRMDR